MTDEPKFQVALKDGNSSLTFSPARDGIAARGRRDAALLVREVPPCELGQLPLWRLRNLAEAGGADAQVELGDKFRAGSNIGKDPVEAAGWYRKAAEQRHLYALYALGEMYEKGEGVPQSHSEALRYFRTATDDDWEWGYWDPDVFTNMWEKAAQLGDAKAQYLFGRTRLHFLDRADEGTCQDYLEEAAKWFRKAAEQDLPEAQYKLGHMYFKGEGLPRDYEEALRWLRKAADHGFANAQIDIGLMYLEGEGVQQSYEQAAYWLRKAAALNALAKLAYAWYHEGRYTEGYVWMSFAADNLSGDDQKTAIQQRTSSPVK